MISAAEHNVIDSQLRTKNTIQSDAKLLVEPETN